MKLKPARFRLTSWIDEDGGRYFDLRDYSPDDSGWRQHFGDVVAGQDPGGGWPEAKMRDHLRTVLGWSPAVIDAAISAAIEDGRGYLFRHRQEKLFR